MKGNSKGVSFDKRRKKWNAYVVTEGKKKHLGSFENRDDAITETQKTMTMKKSKTITQIQKVLNWLEKRPITPLDALRHLGVYRLSSVIHILRQHGHNIETTIMYTPDSQYAKYSLKKKAE